MTRRTGQPGSKKAPKFAPLKKIEKLPGTSDGDEDVLAAIDEMLNTPVEEYVDADDGEEQ